MTTRVVTRYLMTTRAVNPGAVTYTNGSRQSTAALTLVCWCGEQQDIDVDRVFNRKRGRYNDNPDQLKLDLGVNVNKSMMRSFSSNRFWVTRF